MTWARGLAVKCAQLVLVSTSVGYLQCCAMLGNVQFTTAKMLAISRGGTILMTRALSSTVVFM